MFFCQRVQQKILSLSTSTFLRYFSSSLSPIKKPIVFRYSIVENLEINPIIFSDRSQHLWAWWYLKKLICHENICYQDLNTRISFPWYNFLASPNAWNCCEIQHRIFLLANTWLLFSLVSLLMKWSKKISIQIFSSNFQGRKYVMFSVWISLFPLPTPLSVLHRKLFSSSIWQEMMTICQYHFGRPIFSHAIF